MSPYKISNNERPTGYYKSNTPFNNKAQRRNRIKKGTFSWQKATKFAKMVAEEKAGERALMLALRANDEAALQSIAIAVAFSVLSCE